VNDHESNGQFVKLPEGKTVLIAGYTAVHQEMHNCLDCNSYSELFREHAIYCDEEVQNNRHVDPCKQAQTPSWLELAPSEQEYWSKVV